MANPKHLAKLKEGVESWNSWRRNNEFNEVDLSGADLSDVNFSEADLSGVDLKRASLIGANLVKTNLNQADLSWADLREVELREAILKHANLGWANLRGANLRGANLKRANLNSVDLNGADLSGADLNGVNLSGADLNGVNLSRADLYKANLYKVDLSGANLWETLFGWTIFAFTNLSATKGLERCSHGGPSSIDYNTLKQSGSLPVNFLRGSGLPDVFIDYLPSLLEQPIQFYSCFISYSSQDEEFTRRLYTDLQDQGVRCWYAPEDMKIGDKIRVRIDEVIRLHEKLLIVLSDTSVASDWVEKEVETAFEKEWNNKETVLFPIRLDDAVMDCETGWAADIRRTRHIGDFGKWKDHDAYKESLDKLLRDLKADQNGRMMGNLD